MSVTNKDLAEQLNRYMLSPIEMQAVASDMIRLASDGELTLVDPSCPFVYLLEVATATAANQNARDESRVRELYPKLATNWSQLYRWMYDESYVGRFAMPGKTEIIYSLGYQEILDRAVEIPNTIASDDLSRSYSRKLVIPRTTAFTVAGMDFGLHYPIEIQVQAHDQIRVVYNTDNISPLQTLESNQVEYGVVRVKAGKVLVMRIPLFQFKTLVKDVPFNSVHGMNSSITFEDQFYHCRAYMSSDNDTWTEIATTHSQQIYDPLTPTIALQVEGNKLNWRVPEIYLSQGTMDKSTIRLEVLTTKGKISVDPSDYDVTDWKDNYIDLSPKAEQKYSAPLSAFNIKGIYSEGALSGGRSALTFEEQRERVMAGVNKTKVPITGTQVELVLQDAGYGMVTTIDNVTNRSFLATRDLPQLSDSVPQAGSLMGSFYTSAAALVKSKFVADNGDRITIKPDCLYRDSNGSITLLSDDEIDRINAGNSDAKLNAVNNAMLFYSPFHYVLDATSDFDIHAYYLDAPKIGTQAFLDANETIPLTAMVTGYRLDRIAEGYRLSLIVEGNDAWKALDDKNVHIQLGFNPRGEGDYATMLASPTTDEQGRRLFTFDITTNYDFTRILADDSTAYEPYIALTSFSMYESTPRDYWASLQQYLEIFHVVTDYAPEDVDGILHSASDNYLVKKLTLQNGYCFYRERLTATFGYDLDGLWMRSRTVASEITYKRYTENIPWVYDEDIPATDETGSVIIEQGEGGTLSVKYLHRKGDPKLNSDGSQAYRYLKGDIMKDNYGNPIPVDEREVLRNLDMFFIDASYLLANDTDVIDYRNAIPTQLIEWIKNDIITFRNFCYEETEISLYPKQSLGYVDVIVENGLETTLPAALSFNVTLYLPAKQYADLDLRQVLQAMVSKVINECLTSRTVAKAEMIAMIREEGGDDILNVEIDDFGPGKNLSVYTAKNDGVRCAVKKELYVKADGILSVREAIDVSFVKHAQSNSSALAQGLRV